MDATDPPAERRRQTCPRRMTDWGPWDRREGLDWWEERRNGASCSFCGSLHPDVFMDRLREGWVLVPTDKTYKAYIGRPASAEDRERARQVWLAGFTDAEVAQLAHNSGKTVEEARADLVEHHERHATVDVVGDQTKFYYPHLDQQQRVEFVELVNTRRLTIGYPGYLYVLPFFARVIEPAGKTGGDAAVEDEGTS